MFKRILFSLIFLFITHSALANDLSLAQIAASLDNSNKYSSTSSIQTLLGDA